MSIRNLENVDSHFTSFYYFGNFTKLYKVLNIDSQFSLFKVGLKSCCEH